MRAAVVVGVLSLAVSAQGAPAPPSSFWVGVFEPSIPAHPPFAATVLTPASHAGSVRVFAPDKGEAAAGPVKVIAPLLGKVADGTVEAGRVALADFAYDQRDGDDTVLVVPAAQRADLVAVDKGDAAAIRAVLKRDPALAGVAKAVAKLELAGVDLDGDKKPDLALVYGCSEWFDGSCQSHGAFVLVKRGGRWFERE